MWDNHRTYLGNIINPGDIKYSSMFHGSISTLHNYLKMELHSSAAIAGFRNNWILIKPRRGMKN